MNKDNPLFEQFDTDFHSKAKQEADMKNQIQKNKRMYRIPARCNGKTYQMLPVFLNDVKAGNMNADTYNIRHEDQKSIRQQDK